MAINLNKYRDLLVSAWKDVLDDKTTTDWALFGYEGQTNDLKVVNSGSAGIDELTEDLNSGKIMYAFLKVNDPKTSLPKCVLINWQGEGANTVRKGICANHLRDIERLFSGANLTINARNEEEVEPQLIIDKVSRTGSAYSFKAPRSDTSGQNAPIGTNYQRVNPIKEINSKDRDQFWLKEELEEKSRVAEERKRLDLEKQRLEKELRLREVEEAAKRDEKTNLRNSGIDQIKEAELRYNNVSGKQAEVDRKSFEEQTGDTNGVSAGNTRNQSDLVKVERNKEALELIAQRTIDARSIFERNTAAGQRRTPEKPVRASIVKAQQQKQQLQEVTQVDGDGDNTTIIQSQPLNKIEPPNKEQLPPLSNLNDPTTALLSNLNDPTTALLSNLNDPTTALLSNLNDPTTAPLSNLNDPTTALLSNFTNPTAPLSNFNEPTALTEPTPLSLIQAQQQPVEESDEDSDQFATIKRSPKDPSASSSIIDVASKRAVVVTASEEEEEELQETLRSNTVANSGGKQEKTIIEKVEKMTEQQFVDEVLYGDSDPGIQARALYDYQAADDTEITFDPGEIITNIEMVDDGWWQGLGPDGTYGLFPANYVELINYPT